METAFIVALAFLPVLVLLLYIRYKDRAQPEPLGRLLVAFLMGCFAVPASLFLSVPFGLAGLYPEVPAGLGDCVRVAFFAAAVPEEFAKFFMLWLLLRGRRHFDEHMDGIVYAVFVSLGFAALENLMYLFADEESYVATGIARAVFAIPGHCCFGILMGYYYSLLVFGSARRRWNRAMLFAAPVVAHGVYDAILFMQEQVPDFVGGLLFLLFMLFCALMWRYCHRRIELHLRRDAVFLAHLPPLPRADALPPVPPPLPPLPPVPAALPPVSLSELPPVPPPSCAD